MGFDKAADSRPGADRAVDIAVAAAGTAAAEDSRLEAGKAVDSRHHR